MLDIMTLSARNNFFKMGIAFASLSVLFIIAASFVTIPVYSSLNTDNFRRPGGFFQLITGHFLNPNFYAVHTSLAVLVVFSLVAVSLIYYFFEKTHSPEILYIAVFVISLAVESMRLILPLTQLGEISPIYLLIVSRVLLFGRYAGIFSLFAAGLYAAGLDSRNQRNLIFIILITAIIIALGGPVATFTWDTGFNTISDSASDSIFPMLNAGILLVTVASFFIAAYSRGSKEYVFIGLGVFMAFTGRSMLLVSDTWAGLAGIPLLSLGIWFICNYLHKVYLWL